MSTFDADGLDGAGGSVREDVGELPAEEPDGAGPETPGDLPATGPPPVADRTLLAFRLIAHVVACSPILIGVVGSALGGWQPAGDGGAITIRSWAELTSNGSLVGQATSTKGVFELGPLEYWLLAIPSHLNSHVGSLVGAGLFCLVAVALAVEALYSAFGPSGALLGAAAMAGNFVWMPVIVESPVW
ncbi:MAG TPA: hypothetical protein VGP46_10055, partial [Acidimicrobiales bacterium]|nr:hypothetical protein [Acidimicrobiales bacterium]